MTVSPMDRLASLDALPRRAAWVGFAVVLLLIAGFSWAISARVRDQGARVEAIATRFDDAGLRSIAADPANATAFDRAIDRICARRHADQCWMLDRAGVLSRWAAIRRDAALPNAFEIEIDRLTGGAPL